MSNIPKGWLAREETAKRKLALRGVSSDADRQRQIYFDEKERRLKLEEEQGIPFVQPTAEELEAIYLAKYHPEQVQAEEPVAEPPAAPEPVAQDGDVRSDDELRAALVEKGVKVDGRWKRDRLLQELSKD